jgi:hypothetical protein
MKKIITICAAILMTANVFAQSPNKMSYQAVVRNSSGNLVSNTSVGMKISILQGSSSGSAVYIETHIPTTNANGLVSLEIGGGTLVNGNFSTINWANGPYFIKTETDPSGGINYSISGTSQLVSVPYAFHAETASSVSGLSLSLNDLSDVNSSGATSNQVLSFNGTNWVPVTTSGGTVYSAGSGLSLSGTTFSNSAPDQTVTLSGSGATSISGTYPNFTISSTDNNTTYTAGTGLTLTGTTFSAQNTTALWNANQLQGRTIASTPPSSGQALVWNGSNWAPATVSGGSLWTQTSSNIYYNAGKVGIGTTTPAYKLDVVHTPTSNTDNRAISITSTGYTDAATNSIGLRNSLVGNGSYINTGIYSEVSGTSIFGNYAGSFYIPTSSGENLIGLRSEVQDGATIRNYGVFGYTTGTTGLYNGGGMFFSEGVSSNNNYGVYGYASNGGGGTSYSVYGDGLSADYAGYFDGNVTVTGIFSNPSDRKLKKNISDVSSVIPNLMKLHVKSYEYDSESYKLGLPKGKQFGFIAQDMELVYPELVNLQKQIKPTREGSEEKSELIEYKAINYIGLIPILTKAFQEQTLKIVELEKKNAELEERLNKLEKLIKE